MKMSIILSTLVLLANIWIIHGNIHTDTVDKFQKKGFKKAAVLDSDAHSIAGATKGGFKIKPDESNQLVKLFNDPISAYSSGFTLDGVKYETVTKADERSLYGKKGKEGAIIVRTNSHFLIGIYNATLNPGVAANAVEERGDVYRDNGY